MITATISQEAKKLVIRVQRNIIGIITEPCKETKYRYEVNVNGKKGKTKVISEHFENSQQTNAVRPTRKAGNDPASLGDHIIS